MLIAEAVPPQVLAAVPLMTTICAFLVAGGMLWIYRHSFSVLLTGLADAFDRVHVDTRLVDVKPMGAIAGRLRRIDHSIIDAFETYLTGCELAIGLYWGIIADSTSWMATELADLAETAAGAVGRVVRHSIPSAENRAVSRAKRDIHPTKTTVQHTTVVTLPRVKTNTRVVDERVGALSDRVGNLAHRIRAQEKRLAAGATAAAVMIALRSMGLKWLRCGNVRRLGKRLCGMDPSILEAALIGGLAISGALSLERMTRDLLAQMDVFEAALRRGYKEI